MHKTIAAGIELLSSLKDMNIRFNPRPFTNPTPSTPWTTAVAIEEETPFDFHMAVAQKVDALIAEWEQQNESEELSQPEMPHHRFELDVEQKLSELATTLR